MATSNQTVRVFELLKKFNNGHKVCIESLSNESLWYGKSEKTIRRDLEVIKKYFPESYDYVKGEKGCYKAITKNAFNNFVSPEIMSLMIQMFNLANKSNLFENFSINEDDKRILESKIKESKKYYEFKSKPFENIKSDSVLLKELENKIKHQKYIKIQYEINKQINKFEVKPYKIIFINENFYLACEVEHEDLEFAMYRLSKIKSIEDTPKTFHKNIEIDDFIKNMQTPFARYKQDYKKYLINVILEVDKSKAFYFESKKFLKSQELIEKKDNGNILLSFYITQEIEIEDLIKKWIPFVKVVEPFSLKEKINNDLKMYLKNNS